MQKKVYIDVIRVLSIIMIICCHFSCTFQQYQIEGFNNYFLRFPSTDTGILGVTLFFMISGSSLIYRYRDSFDIGKFYKKRFLSILPPLWFCWIVFYFIEVVKRKEFLYNGSLFRIFWTLIGMDYYVGGIVPTYALVGEWFTGAIIILYILFPLLRLIYLNRYLRIATTAILFGIFLRCLFYSSFASFAPRGNQSIFVHLFYFWVGIILTDLRDAWRKISWYMLLLVGIPFLVLSYSLPISLTTFIIATIIYLSIGKIEGISFLSKELKSIFSFLVSHSYFIYLCHHQIIYLIMSRFRGQYLPIWKGLLLLITCMICIFGAAFVMSFTYNRMMSFIRPLDIENRTDRIMNK